MVAVDLLESGLMIEVPSNRRVARRATWWANLLHVARGALLVSFILLEFVAGPRATPYWAGHHIGISLIMIIVIILVVPFYAIRFMTSKNWAATLRQLEGAASAEVLDKIYKYSRILVLVVLTNSVGAAGLVMAVIVPLLFTHPDMERLDSDVRVVCVLAGVLMCLLCK